jgi:hypothetical protein
MMACTEFSSYIIGEGPLPLGCAQILLERGYIVYGMISSDTAVRDWARERGIAHIDPKDQDIVPFLSRQPFDYLFSIVNMSVLPRWVLELPRRGGINFHDAPLPSYAGAYATYGPFCTGKGSMASAGTA